jgi:hypothetical protein
MQRWLGVPRRSIMSDDERVPPPDQTATSAEHRHVVSVSFRADELAWVDSIVSSLKAVGYRQVSRSEVVNVALGALRESVGDRSPYDMLRYFLDRRHRS